MTAPPSSEAELMQRARALAGRSLAEVAAEFGRQVPEESRRGKGFAGALCELALGGDAGSRAVPDFQQLGIELKTIPVSRSGKPLETTFVCTIPMDAVADTEWRQSRTYKKLRRVLWVPLLAERSIPLPSRMFGSAFLWSPDAEEEAALRFDWEEATGLIGRGRAHELSGRLGRVLQVRPKAAHGGVRRWLRTHEGEASYELPRGFYLRPEFTAGLLRRHLVMPEPSA